jgi:cell division protein FtsQ
VKEKQKIKNRSFFFLISFLSLTSLLSLRAIKKVNIHDIRITGSELFSQSDVVENSSLKFPIRLIFIKIPMNDKMNNELVSLKNVSVNRELFPFGLKIFVNTRTPIAYAERILNEEKILGFVDKDGMFIQESLISFLHLIFFQRKLLEF